MGLFIQELELNSNSCLSAFIGCTELCLELEQVSCMAPAGMELELPCTSDSALLRAESLGL